ncbi:hypothetical protein HanIR_Chr05g0209591 [Helianthus annuus]|nr:hypothetical protein HanIR_Chr05g0209591 [Helianthus annuus]
MKFELERLRMLTEVLSMKMKLRETCLKSRELQRWFRSVFEMCKFMCCKKSSIYSDLDATRSLHTSLQVFLDEFQVSLCMKNCWLSS